jgi:DNA-directed RNA polymerase specialized sigma24 family protein
MTYRAPNDIDPTARDVIRRKIKALCRQPRWYAPCDREDVDQELSLHAHVVAPRLDSSRSSPRTFFELAITRHLFDLRVKASARCRDWRRSAPLNDRDCFPRLSAARHELQLDVRRALATAPPPLRHFAHVLSYFNLASTARCLGITRQEARTRRQGLALHLMAHGLGDSSWTK